MTTDLMTRVVAAEVYPDRARVTRVGDLTVAAGRCSIRIMATCSSFCSRRASSRS